MTERDDGGPRKLCSASDGKIERCFGLDAVLDGYGSENRKGVLVWSFINMDTNKQTRQLIGVKSGKHKKDGLIFNFCPFCGEHISDGAKEYSEHREAQTRKP